MRETDERFLAIANQSASLLADRGLRRDDAIVDIGCGYGRLAFGLLNKLNFRGRYEGFDILSRQVEWCQQAITPRYPNFRFSHVDISNERYNPSGIVASNEVRFPYADQSFDCASLFSVFTHMYAVDIIHYMTEIKRVLREDGICVATFFVFNEQRLAAITSDSCDLPMRFELSDVSRYFNKDNVLHAISYGEGYLRDLWTNHGFSVISLEWGSWAGHPPDSPFAPVDPDMYQDMFTLVSSSTRPSFSGRNSS